MRYLVFSDLHGSDSGWTALQNHPEFSRDGQKRVCLGDVVEFDDNYRNYYQAVAAKSDVVILGNHEAVLTGASPVERFNPKVHEAILATKADAEQHHPDLLATFQALPQQLREGDVSFTHGSYNPVDIWKHVRYIEDLKDEQPHLPSRFNFLAHGHIPFVAWLENDLWYYQRQIYAQPFTLDGPGPYIVNSGSILGSREMRQHERTFLTYDPDTQQLIFYNLSV